MRLVQHLVKTHTRFINVVDWGKPEQVDHKREVRVARLSSYLSIFLFVCMFMTQYTRAVLIYGVPSVVDYSIYGIFSQLPCMPIFNKHVVTNTINKQVLLLRSKFMDH